MCYECVISCYKWLRCVVTCAIIGYNFIHKAIRGWSKCGISGILCGLSGLRVV